MDVLRVRVELADEPGALAGLTAVLAGIGVDVASVDVLEVDAVTVVDELVLRLPAQVGARDVEHALRVAGVGQVLSTHMDGPRTDITVRALDLMAAVLAGSGDAELVGRALATIAYADSGALLDVEQASQFSLARRACAQGVPTSGRARSNASPFGVPGGWVLWVTPAVEDPRQIAVVARRVDVRFSATEVARLRGFVTLLAALRSLQTSL